ncbi:hypothetical protein ACIPIN_22725 [Pseudomonas sp. NPDC087697]
MTATPALNQALPANLHGRTVVIFGGTSGIGWPQPFKPRPTART